MLLGAPSVSSQIATGVLRSVWMGSPAGPARVKHQRAPALTPARAALGLDPALQLARRRAAQAIRRGRLGREVRRRRGALPGSAGRRAGRCRLPREGQGCGRSVRRQCRGHPRRRKVSPVPAGTLLRVAAEEVDHLHPLPEGVQVLVRGAACAVGPLQLLFFRLGVMRTRSSEGRDLCVCPALEEPVRTSEPVLWASSRSFIFASGVLASNSSLCRSTVLAPRFVPKV